MKHRLWAIVKVAAFWFTQVSAKYQSEDVLRTIQQINTHFSTQTNIFFDFDGIQQEHPFSSKTLFKTPSIIITSPVNYQLIYTWNKDILVVAYVSENSRQTLYASLNLVLHKMHHVNMLFVLLDTANPRTIFKWAWQNGFKNSIALFWSKGGVQLSEFNPFPRLTLVNISDIRESSLQKDMRNMHGYPIRTVLGNDPPVVYRYINRQGKPTMSGSFYKIFDLFINHYNATVEEVALPFPYPDTFRLQDFNDAVRRNVVDIGVYPSQTDMDFLSTNAIYMTFLHLMVPYAKPVQQSLYVVLPFKSWTWAGLAGTILIFAIGIDFASRMAAAQRDLGRHFLQALSGVLNISFGFRLHKSKVLLLIFVLLSTAGIMLSNLYLAQLSTFLTTIAYEKQINSVKDAVASDLTIAITKGEFEIYQMLKVPQVILDKVKIVDAATAAHNRRILNSSVIDIGSKQKYRFYAHQQFYLKKPLVKLLLEPVVHMILSFLMSYTSPYTNMYSTFMQRTFESGFPQKFANDLNHDGITEGWIAFIKPNETEVAALNLECFRVSWYLLGLGCGLGTFCLAFEVVYFKFKNRVILLQ